MVTKKFLKRLSATLVLLVGYTATAAENEMDELDRWLDAELAVQQVNEGVLSFLPAKGHDKVHYHQNELKISKDSINDGWVQLNQCHTHLDKVPRLQILFRENFARNLKVTTSQNIEKAWVEGHRVLLRNIQENAKICISAETRALRNGDSGKLELHSGPFMRQFLDGYYPMHVSMKITYPAGLLKLTTLHPSPQPGFDIKSVPGSISYDTFFEGKLKTIIGFERIEEIALNKNL